MEMSCDERVLRELARPSGARVDVKADYSQTLLSLSMNRCILGASPLAFGEGGVKERVKNVLNFKKRSRVIVLDAVALLAVVTVGFAVNRGNEPKFANFSAIVIDDFVFDRNTEDFSAIDLYDNGIGALTVFLRHAENKDNPSSANKSGVNISSIEQIEELLGKGVIVRLTTPDDKGRQLVTERYSNEDGLSVRFAYTETAYSGIGHRLVWVDFAVAEASEKTPLPGAKEGSPRIAVYEYNGDAPGSYSLNPFRDSNSTDGFVELPAPNDDGAIVLNERVTIAAEIPINSVSAVIYYQYTDGNSIKPDVRIGESNYAKPLAKPQSLITDFYAADWFPNGFSGQIWAVSTDADGNAHYSERLNVVYAPQTYTPLSDYKPMIYANGNLYEDTGKVLTTLPEGAERVGSIEIFGYGERRAGKGLVAYAVGFDP
jgi:hypothetical protein